MLLVGAFFSAHKIDKGHGAVKTIGEKISRESGAFT